MSSGALRIRRARQEESPRIASFARRTFADAFGADMGEDALALHFRENMSDARFAAMLRADAFHLASSGDALAGFVQVGRVDPGYRRWVEHLDPDGAEVRRLYVLAERQGQGVGTALLECALRDERVRGADVTYLTTWEANHGAQKLYRAHGFRRVGEIPEYANDGRLNGYEYVMARGRTASGP